uniref:ubiquitinyl hydrolase 1 n=1 Tax=Anolis carolinensis TaxID=28377 RepID=A0A803SMV1_ANOCA
PFIGGSAGIQKKYVNPGCHWCLIDIRWFRQWKKDEGFEYWDLYYAGKLLADLETQTLKEYCINKVDSELIPIAAWNKLVNWYGCIEGQKPLERKVAESGEYFKYSRVSLIQAKRASRSLDKRISWIIRRD